MVNSSLTLAGYSRAVACQSPKETAVKHSEFRALETNSRSDRTDDVFAGAVSAFCSLTRPLRHDIVQLEELAMPLLERASSRAKRHAAAALSESPDAPKALLMALAQEPIEISAPLLLRSPVLAAVDLITLVHRCGLKHARIIARRRNPSPELVRLLQGLDDPAIARALAIGSNGPQVAGGQDAVADPGPTGQAHRRPATLGDVRAALRDIMEESASAELDDEAGGVLLRKALDDNGALFQTALADALGVSFGRSGRIIGSEPGAEFFSALRALDLSMQDAYFLTGLVYGIAEASRDELKAFARSYTAIDRDAARAAVRRWKAEEISQRLRRHRPEEAEARARRG
jgi:uncharacterized protein (DUF2336 family)